MSCTQAHTRKFLQRYTFFLKPANFCHENLDNPKKSSNFADEMQPFKFTPYLKTVIWGGDRIAAMKGILTSQSQIGESWEISAIPGHESVCSYHGADGVADVGQTLPELIARYQGALVGEEVYRRFGTTFPLLIKFIDAKQDLSVQVHPNDELAQARHGCLGKTEMWYVLDADRHAKIYSGLREPLTAEEYETLSGREVMARIAAHKAERGQVYHLPAGRLHAIGAGTLLAEIQETSDITYRVYDYDREDAQGNRRTLHVAEARDAIDYRVEASYLTDYDRNTALSTLVSCPHFRTWRLNKQNTEEQVYDLNTPNFVVVICLSGRLWINGVDVWRGGTMLVPACDNRLHIIGRGEMLLATV